MSQHQQEGTRAYSRHLQRIQASQTPAEIEEGLEVWFAQALPSSRRGLALDYGSGRGQALAWLAGHGFAEVEAYEPDQTLASNLQALGHRVHTGSAPAQLLKELAGRYSLIFCKDVLEHLPREETVELVQLLRAALSPGGRLIVSVPHAVSFVGVYVRYADFTHHTAFTESSLRFVLEQGGFSQVSSISPNFRWKPNVRTIGYRALRRAWHLCLRGIYYLENPSHELRPPHFFPRLVMTADKL